MVCNTDPMGTAMGSWQALSQSPYGAKWFATLMRKMREIRVRAEKSQSPYGAKWFATFAGEVWPEAPLHGLSQSPYGAKWFATKMLRAAAAELLMVASRNPLTGLSGLQLASWPACSSRL